MFRLTKEKVPEEFLKSQIATLSWGGRRKLPYAFTENGLGRKGFLTNAVVNDFADQYPPLYIKPNPDCHDRWIVLDYGLKTEQVYHCGVPAKTQERNFVR